MKTIILQLLLIPSVVYAQGTSLGANFLLVPNTARVASLAQSSVADSGDFSSALLNPAVLATSPGSEILLAHTQWVQDVQIEFIGVSAPVPYGKLGFAVSNMNIGGLEVRETPGPATATFSAHSAALQIMYATSISSDISLGTSVKYLYEKIYVDDATGYAFDIGVLYKMPMEGFLVGLALTNVGSMGSFRTSSSDLPSQLHIGSSYSFAEENWNVGLTAAYTNETKAHRSRVSFGTEARYDNMVSVRIGYETGFQARGLTTGFGVRYSFVKCDYAYIPWSQGLGNVQIVSLGFVL